VKSVFNDAKKVFTRGADAGQLVGREKEREELESFVNDCIERKEGGCLYVSGPPGTGKSAFVTQICTSLEKKHSTKYAYINCMSVKSATELYDLMAAELAMDDAVCQGFSKDALQTAFTKPGNNDDDISLVVLDEIDQLLGLDNSTLCSFFEWSFAKDSKLILIGIANALDLTDRFLPRLKAKNLKPALLPFLPYTAPQIASVLSSRARSLLPSDSSAAVDFTPFLHPTAITLISKKVASQTGDLRKAFDMAFHAIELVEAETKDKCMKEALLLAQQQEQEQEASEPASPTRTPLSETVNNTSCALSSPPPSTSSTPRATRTSIPTTTSLTNLTTITAPRATLAHIVRVTTSTQSASSATARLKTLNLHQKAILCSLVALEAKLLASSASTTLPENKKRPLAKTSLPSPNTTPTTKRKLFTPITPSKQSTTTTLTAPTLRTLYTTYTHLCTRDNILHALSSTEFRDVVSNLETMSLVTAADAASTNTNKCSRSSANGSNSGLFSSSITGTPSKRGGGGKNATVIPVDERRVKAMVGIKDMEGAVEGVGGGVLRGMLRGELIVGF